MAYLVNSSNISLNNNQILFEGSLEYIDAFTVNYIDSLDMVNKNKDTFNLYSIKGMTKDHNIRLFIYDVIKHTTIEKAILFKKHAYAFQQIIANNDLFINLLHINNCLIPRYYLKLILFKNDRNYYIGKMLSELYEQGKYYQFMRNVLNSYNVYSKINNDVSSLKSLYQEYKNILTEKNTLNYDRHEMEEFLTENELKSMYDCGLKDEIIISKFDDVLDTEEFVYLNDLKDFISDTNFPLFEVLTEAFPNDLVTNDKIKFDNLDNKNNITLLIGGIGAENSSYLPMLQVMKEYQIPVLLLGNRISYKIKNNLKKHYPQICVLNYNNKNFNKLFIEYFKELHYQKKIKNLNEKKIGAYEKTIK